MKAVVFRGIRSLAIEDRPLPALRDDADVVVRVIASCVCGSDLWWYRDSSDVALGAPCGHEFVGEVFAVGTGVRTLTTGDLVVAPFRFSCGSCAECQFGVSSACRNGGNWDADTGGGQGEFVRVPYADNTLVIVPSEFGRTPARLASLATLCDVFATGFHAATSAGVATDSTVAVIGDGAVGLSAILAAKLLGASRIITFSGRPDRQRIAREQGAHQVIDARGASAVSAVLDVTADTGVDSVLECVGTAEAMKSAIAMTRAGGTVGFVGIPHDVKIPIVDMFVRNVAIHGGMAPVRSIIDHLIPDVLAGKLNPGLVIDHVGSGLETIIDGYEGMSSRANIKTMALL